MLPDLDKLVRLQHLDSTISDARQTLAAHPQRLAEADARLQGAQQQLDAARERLKNNQDARRALEKDVAVYQGRISKFRDQQAAVKTNKEYQALGHEMETAARDLSSVEERMLERMMEADTIAAEVKQAEAAFAAQQTLIEAEKKELAADLAAVQTQLAKATESRAALINDLPKPLLSLFEQVAHKRRGLAVCSATRDGLCSVCHVRLRPQVFQQVRHNDSVIQCDSCQRILYYVPPPPPVEHPIVRT
jgi:uncharacterized protein